PRSRPPPQVAPADHPPRSAAHIGSKDRRNPAVQPSLPPLSRSGIESRTGLKHHGFFEVSSSSVIAFTLRVETPCTYISASVATRTCSERWERSNSSVEKRPARYCGTRSSACPPA